MNSKQILETLRMQPLSEEEKNRRHILGRLYGPIATSNSSTRNGRKYNRDLWEKALQDDIFKEKIANKSLFLELGHPQDREETDMEKICACIPEMPKIVDGDLFAYVDILDTKNGKLLKTLCDYGFVPGISSRGSGDIMPNDEVDPDTFFLETWDIVALPAVKDARLQMCESLNTNKPKLKAALMESYKKATKKEKKAMKEALDSLNIDVLDEEDDSNIPEIPDELREAIKDPAEENEQEVLDDNAIADLAAVDDESIEQMDVDNVAIEDEEPAVEDKEPSEEDSKEEESDEKLDDEKLEDEKEVETVGELLKSLKEFDKKAEIEFAPIIIDDVEYPVEALELDDSEDGKVIISINYSQETGDNIEIDELEDIEPEEEIPEEPENAEEEVIDDEAEEVIESLKEMIRQKDALENEVKDLKNDKAVSDAEVEELKENLNKYKAAFARTSKIAAKANKLESEVNQLHESLSKANKKLLLKDRENATQINESVEKANRKVAAMKRRLDEANKELENSEKKLNEQASAYKKKLNESTQTARAYKNKCHELLEKYISFRASMLGVRPAEITKKLNESYSIEDVDAICDSILTESSVNMNRMSLGLNRNSRVQIKENVATRNNSAANDDLDDLLELAGLK